MQSNSGLAAAQAGMKRAEDHAERVLPDWRTRAEEFLRSYALRHATFTAEEVVEASCGLVPAAPDARAWGGVFARASRRGHIVVYGFENAQSAKVHNHIVRRWQRVGHWSP